MRPVHAILALITLFAASLLPPHASGAGEPICAFGSLDRDASSTVVSTFDPGTPSWEYSAQTSGVGWHASSKSGKNAVDYEGARGHPWRLYYGSSDATRQDYATGQAGNSGTASSPIFRVPENASSVALVFDSKYEVEARRPATHDQMLVHTSTNGGPWQVLCRISPTTAYNGDPDESVCSRGILAQGAYPCPSDATGTLPEWGTRVISLNNAAGSNVRVRFEFQSVDSNFNHAMGWMVDDVRIAYHAPPPPDPSVQSPYACSDGDDNDGDGKTDYPVDTGCSGPQDNGESPECSDGIDNDSDGKTDHPADAGCESASDDAEFPDPQQVTPRTPFMAGWQLILLGVTFLAAGTFLAGRKRS